MPEEYDPKSNASKQLISKEILKIIYNPAPLEDAFHITGTKPDAPKVQPPWTVESLAEKLKHGQVDSLTRVREAVKMLYRDSYVKSVPGGYDLTEKGKRESERLGAKPA